MPTDVDDVELQQHRENLEHRRARWEVATVDEILAYYAVPARSRPKTP
ncbi:MAG: hypothetical protein SFX73_00585 [Kofleriaceae bacterium]|nr:hypothetical protein [Kofleriaceae bacterium]